MGVGSAQQGAAHDGGQHFDDPVVGPAELAGQDAVDLGPGQRGGQVACFLLAQPGTQCALAGQHRRDHAPGAAVFLHKAAVQEIVDIGVHAAGGQQDGEGVAVPGREAEADADRDGDLPGRVSGGGVELADSLVAVDVFLHLLLERQQESPFGAEPGVDGGFGDLRRRGDRFDGGGGIAALSEQAQGRGEDVGAGLGGLPLAAAGVVFPLDSHHLARVSPY
jgi:hypothetical protein